MIQQILRDLPDTARNRELMDEYYSLIEKIRATGKASLEIRKRLSELTSTQGAHIKTESVVRVNAY
jgi:flagellar motor component MotA